MSTCLQTLLACECRPVAPGCERVTAVGEIDLATGPRLTDALREAQARAQSVVLDLSGATFIDASGVRILLAADRRARAASGTFAIAHPSWPVERVLQLVGADRALDRAPVQSAARRLTSVAKCAPPAPAVSSSDASQRISATNTKIA